MALRRHSPIPATIAVVVASAAAGESALEKGAHAQCEAEGTMTACAAAQPEAADLREDGEPAAALIAPPVPEVRPAAPSAPPDDVPWQFWEDQMADGTMRIALETQRHHRDFMAFLHHGAADS